MIFVVASSSSNFQFQRSAGRPERLLRSSITAFCATPRPTKREIAQLDDLAVPLLECVSDECLRFAAAALSDLPHAPALLVRRLADMPVEISAPMLMRSPVLTNIDLVALIGRHGLPHARVIATRTDLDERIARLIRSIDRLEQSAPDKAEETRNQLLAMMQPSEQSAEAPQAAVQLRWDGDPGTYRKLRSTALAGIPPLFHTALADALDIEPSLARDIAQSDDLSELLIALRFLSLSPEQAFLIVQCTRPDRFAQARAVAAFLDAFEALDQEKAAIAVDGWRGDETPANAANSSPSPKSLKAS